MGNALRFALLLGLVYFAWKWQRGDFADAAKTTAGAGGDKTTIPPPKSIAPPKKPKGRHS